VVELSPFTVYPRSTDAQFAKSSARPFRVCDRERLRFVCPSMTLPKLKGLRTTFTAASRPVPVSGIVRENPFRCCHRHRSRCGSNRVGANVTVRVAWLRIQRSGAVMPLARTPLRIRVTPVICSDPFRVREHNLFHRACALPTFQSQAARVSLQGSCWSCCSGAAQRDSQRRICGVVAGDGKASLAAGRGSRAKDKDTAADWPR